MFHQKGALDLLRQCFRRNKFCSVRHFRVSYCVYLRSKRSGKAEIQPQFVAGEFQVQPQRSTNDNFYGIESDEGVIHVSEKTKTSKKRYDYFDKSPRSDKAMETVKITKFGAVRLDHENIVSVHGQYGISDIDEFSDFERYRSSQKQKRLEPYANSLSTESVVERNKDESSEDPFHSESLGAESSSPETNANSVKESFFDESYFGSETLDVISISRELSKSSSHPTVPVYDKVDSKARLDSEKETRSDSYIDKAYFNSSFLENKASVPTEKKGFSKLEQLDCVNEGQTSNEEIIFHDLKSRNFEAETIKINPYIDKSEVKSSFIPKEENLSYIDEFYFNNDNFDRNFLAKTEEDNIKNIKSPVENTQLQEEVRYQTTTKPNKKKLFESVNKNEELSSKAGPAGKTGFLFKRETEASNETGLGLNRSVLKQSPQQIKDENGKSLKLTERKSRRHLSNDKESRDSETAFDHVKTLRQENKTGYQPYDGGLLKPAIETLDSKGFRILKNQVPNLKYFTRDEILKLLVQSVLYSDDDVVVLNKPYSLVIHESNTTKDACLSSYLDDLASELDKSSENPKLFTVHRLDKETTGCLLLARNENSALRLKSLFAQRKILKTYWIVTIRIPDPMEGVIDIPISEGTIGNRSRMVLHPVVPKDVNYKSHSKQGQRAVTQYTVVAESGNAALVEVRPETGIKHQIRVHFGFGLSCPILGDHKYSYLDKFVPQKLPADLLQRLHVRQSKVRHIPMHIYARSITIPQYSEGKNLYVSAPIPLHMSKNLQRLKFKRKNCRKIYLGEPSN